MEDILRLVVRCSEGPNHNKLPGTMPCSECGEDCWSDPRSDELAAMVGNPVHVCTVCFS